MKMFRLIFGLLALSLVTACSSDPDPVEPSEDYTPTPKPLTVPPHF